MNLVLGGGLEHQYAAREEPAIGRRVELGFVCPLPRTGELRAGDRICIIDHGKIVAQGTPASLKSEIGADVIQISLKADRTKNVKDVAREGIRRVPGVEQVQNFDGGILVYAKNGPSLVPQLVRMLDDVGVHISQLTLSAPALDDVFLKHTGHQMRVEEVKPPSRMIWARRRRPMP